ncbi:formyltetrahydrofolate deformylase [Spinactinospora alkalitolerans]|uniref:Formyltetrahydrofolate deformylase n=1 Tax=Spinactinospora alkalitolerans TaxID=687207 RepID=A0A852TSH7_9ACTN|nr:formyltetrahydrofolate deformylase [Spinactinospora alkalitolerans]NYE46485.1 formyltetrahydrofolate deformylase [Spinactinospora alkalitolerans]
MSGGATEPIRGRDHVLTLDCPDRPGIVHAVAEFLVHHDANITESRQFDDPDTGRFFMRVQFETPDPRRSAGELAQGFGWVAEAFGMSWRLVDAAVRTRALILVSRYEHCLNDLLFRRHIGALPIDVALIVSNHPDAADLAASYGLDFRHVPVTPQTKPEAEAELMGLVDELGIDLVVLARYMQILSPELCKRLEGRAINIHHSFLPGFKGSRPYHQAHARGVKLIGATAHYVTPDLDEGPIIEQDVIRVDHSMGAAHLAAVGRDVESQVLARAVRWHSEQRVLLNEGRTVVFA